MRWTAAPRSSPAAQARGWRALLSLDPPLLFLDEPTVGLDLIGAAAFDSLIRTLAGAGLTVFLITHDLDTLYAICDRVAVLADRKVIAVAPVAELETLDHPVQDSFQRSARRAPHAMRCGRQTDGAQVMETRANYVLIGASPC